ncbi:hypothetical protein BDF19DRAFT_144522 [Syncephalis fuscata]|nr:hypothetical protein BDF19DRAFT_144522 [Syncephalis fuscata]
MTSAHPTSMGRRHSHYEDMQHYRRQRRRYTYSDEESKPEVYGPNYHDNNWDTTTTAASTEQRSYVQSPLKRDELELYPENKVAVTAAGLSYFPSPMLFSPVSSFGHGPMKKTIEHFSRSETSRPIDVFSNGYARRFHPIRESSSEMTLCANDAVAHPMSASSSTSLVLSSPPSYATRPPAGIDNLLANLSEEPAGFGIKRFSPNNASPLHDYRSEHQHSPSDNVVSHDHLADDLTNMDENTGTSVLVESTSTERMLIRWIIAGQVPYNIVENEDFRKFCHALDPTFRIPSTQKLTDMVLRNI